MVTTSPATSMRQRIKTRLGRYGIFWLVGGTITVLLIAFIIVLFQPSGNSASPDALHVGHAAPNFNLTDPSGKRFALAQFKGHPVVLNFWGTFCEPCKSETPLLEQTYQKYKDQGLIVIGIDQGEPMDPISQFGKDYALSYILLADTKLAVNNQYGVTGLPVSYFIDSQGVIRSVNNGVLLKDSLTQGLQAIGVK
jgi:cytochrome c biogenesis protein CcmG, thiol:disulfide interchange protein DsbE